MPHQHLEGTKHGDGKTGTMVCHKPVNPVATRQQDMECDDRDCKKGQKGRRSDGDGKKRMTQMLISSSYPVGCRALNRRIRRIRCRYG